MKLLLSADMHGILDAALVTHLIASCVQSIAVSCVVILRTGKMGKVCSTPALMAKTQVLSSIALLALVPLHKIPLHKLRALCMPRLGPDLCM